MDFFAAFSLGKKWNPWRDLHGILITNGCVKKLLFKETELLRTQKRMFTGESFMKANKANSFVKRIPKYCKYECRRRNRHFRPKQQTPYEFHPCHLPGDISTI